MKKNNTYKGIVIKVTSDHIVLMCDGGMFKNVPRNKTDIPELGQRYEYKEKRRWTGFSGLHYLAMASILFLSVIGYTLFSSSVEEVYVVSVDINPSVEIYADENFSILSIHGLNKDGQKIIENIDHKRKKIKSSD